MLLTAASSRHAVPRASARLWQLYFSTEHVSDNVASINLLFRQFRIETLLTALITHFEDCLPFVAPFQRNALLTRTLLEIKPAYS